MLESLRISRSSFLVLFSIWTSFTGGVIGVMALLMFRESVGATIKDPVQIIKARLEAGAYQISSYFAGACVLLLFLTFAVWAQVYLKDSYHSDEGIVRFQARSVFVLSLFAIIGTISAAVFSAVLY